MLTHHHTKSINPTRVVVLGATGFVGSKLVDALRLRQIPVLALSTNDVDLTKEGADGKLENLLYPNDAVVVLAVQEPNNNMHPNAFINNIKIAKNICSAIRQVVCSHVIYFSSDAVYSFDDELISESTLPSPTTLYGVMHLTREILFRDFLVNIPLTIVRSTQIYGVAENHNAYGPSKMIRSVIEEGKIELFGRGEEQRDFIDIKDVVELTILILLYKSSGFVNFATGRSISYADLSEKIRNILHIPFRIEFFPRRKQISHRMFDIKNLKEVFPYFKFTALEECQLFSKILAS